MWFAGDHGDVGGGHAEVGLSSITLEWVLGRARKVGLAVNTKYLKGVSSPDPLMPQIRNGVVFPYTLKNAKVREIPKGSEVHESVKMRIDGVRGYGLGNVG
jgi:hypothetical protein